MGGLYGSVDFWERFMKLRKRTLRLCVLLAFCILAGGVVLAMFQPFYGKKRAGYPGNGVYDLTEYSPYQTEEKDGLDKIQVIDMDFKTNSTKIKIANEGDSDIMIYLYKKGNTGENEDIASFDLASGGKEEFTNLTAASEYRIGVETSGEYALKISD